MQRNALHPDASAMIESRHVFPAPCGRPMHRQTPMDALPLLQSKADILRYLEGMPALLEESGSPDRCFTPGQARHFFAALHANGMSIVGFEIWRHSEEGYALDVEGIWHSHGSDARWNYADALGFLRIAAPSFGDVVTIQFADAGA